MAVKKDYAVSVCLPAYTTVWVEAKSEEDAIRQAKYHVKVGDVERLWEPDFTQKDKAVYEIEED